MSGHDQPEQAVTFKRNGRSRWAGICTDDPIADSSGNWTMSCFPIGYHLIANPEALTASNSPIIHLVGTVKTEDHPDATSIASQYWTLSGTLTPQELRFKAEDVEEWLGQLPSLPSAETDTEDQPAKTENRGRKPKSKQDKEIEAKALNSIYQIITVLAKMAEVDLSRHCSHLSAFEIQAAESGLAFNLTEPTLAKYLKEAHEWEIQNRITVAPVESKN